jgi:mRNA-degrading endonuclease RelE of RelBE toxin-antitoxin system
MALEAAEQLAPIPRVIRVRVEHLLLRLQKWPHVSGAKPLRGNLAGHFRMQTGDWRLQFHLNGDIVVVERIGHRDGFYEE